MSETGRLRAREQPRRQDTVQRESIASTVSGSGCINDIRFKNVCESTFTSKLIIYLSYLVVFKISN